MSMKEKVLNLFETVKEFMYYYKITNSFNQEKVKLRENNVFANDWT